MKLNTQDLAGKLRGIIGDDELASALCEAADKMSVEFEEDSPEEFAKAVTDRMKADNPDLKWPSGGVAQNARKVLAEAWISDDQSNDQDKDPPDKDESSEQDVEPETILVELPPKIKAYGGGFYDREQDLYIKGEKPVKVRRTNFVMRKIADGELLEVKQ